MDSTKETKQTTVEKKGGATSVQEKSTKIDHNRDETHVDNTKQRPVSSGLGNPGKSDNDSKKVTETKTVEQN